MKDSKSHKSLIILFPTCQIRIGRFYQNILPPRPRHPPPPPPRLVVLFLLVLLLASSSNFSWTMTALISTCTSASPTLRPALCQLSSPTLCAKLFANFPAQCAPLDLNRGPAQLSVHRWTSTWDLPSSVCTAGPQRPDRMPEDMPDGMSDRMPEDMPDGMSDRMPEDMPDKMP